ncbi:MAG TPA: hypothetical protein VN516_00860 [Candidatus Baltobacteraceae bacterium]|nr:hypothetical protein [Candidatus Baltobacteraceae bacterium]
MGQGGHFIFVGPRANMPAGKGNELLHHRGTAGFEEKIFVWLALVPQLARVFFAFFAGADGDEQCAVRLRIKQDFPQFF